MGVLTDTELHHIGVIRPANNQADKQNRQPVHDPLTAPQRTRRHLYLNLCGALDVTSHPGFIAGQRLYKEKSVHTLTEAERRNTQIWIPADVDTCSQSLVYINVQRSQSYNMP